MNFEGTTNEQLQEYLDGLLLVQSRALLNNCIEVVDRYQGLYLETKQELQIRKVSGF